MGKADRGATDFKSKLFLFANLMLQVEEIEDSCRDRLAAVHEAYYSSDGLNNAVYS